MVGFQSIIEVKGEQGGAKGSPQQAEVQKAALVTPSLVSVDVEKPQLYVHHHKEAGVQSGVEDSKT